MSIPLIPSAKKSVWLSHLWRAVCYSLYWTKMTITNFLYSFAWLCWVIKLLTTSLLSETLFFLHLSVVSFISLATFPHRSFLGCFLLFSLCSVLYLFYLGPILFSCTTSTPVCILKVLKKKWIKDWFNPQTNLKKTEERGT